MASKKRRARKRDRLQPLTEEEKRSPVGVRFTPSAPGPRRATLRIRHSAGSGEGSVALTGQGAGG